ncbi:MAG: threonine/serine exporter family protein [Bacteroidales bacterium]|nr:threonine/serine exporter family protein [Bacteroidales bacterium]MBR6423971.1 threonine/serine exporter family protein [Bacteroidales bacterium]
MEKGHFSDEKQQVQALEIASEAGHILLENGAEISRVEETMERIATHYGVESKSFFVLSNGIFTTSSHNQYANVEFIPFKGTQLDKVVAVNQLSRDIVAGKYTLDQAQARLREIRTMRPHPVWEQVLASALGSAGFCIVFGGGMLDCAASFVCGILLWLFVLYVTAPHMSKIVGNIVGGLFVTGLCILFHRIGFGHSLPNMIIGAIIPLIPGVPFVNGVRDLANEDYIAGATRLLDALLVFFCIAAGVMLAFVGDRLVTGSMIVLQGMTVDAFTFKMPIQIVASFIGTAAFAVLFGVPRKYYVLCGVSGVLGWILYMILARYAGFTPPAATVFATMLVVLSARWFSVLDRCPAIVFLLCGIFPLVPGAGVFWTSYYVVSDQLRLALSSGFMAVKVTIAIVLGIILISELPNRFFTSFRRR